MGIFISVMALIATSAIALAAWVQTHNAVRPFLFTSFEREPLKAGSYGEKVVLNLRNGGLGPAIIRDFFVVHKQNKYRENEIENLFSEHFEDFEYKTLRPNGAIPAGDTHRTLAIPALGENGDIDQIQKFLHENFTLIVKYKSFLSHNISVRGKDFFFLGYEQTYKSSDHVWDKSKDTNDKATEPE